MQSVRQRGDAAVKELTQKFDRAELDTVCTLIQVPVLCFKGCLFALKNDTIHCHAMFSKG